MSTTRWLTRSRTFSILSGSPVTAFSSDPKMLWNSSIVYNRCKNSGSMAMHGGDAAILYLSHVMDITADLGYVVGSIKEASPVKLPASIASRLLYLLPHIKVCLLPQFQHLHCRRSRFLDMRDGLSWGEEEVERVKYTGQSTKYQQSIGACCALPPPPSRFT